MADTHPNAFRAEATEKRTQAIQLNAAADELEAKADQLEFPDGKPEPEEKVSEDKSEPDKKKLFNR